MNIRIDKLDMCIKEGDLNDIISISSSFSIKC